MLKSRKRDKLNLSSRGKEKRLLLRRLELLLRKKLLSSRHRC